MVSVAVRFLSSVILSSLSCSGAFISYKMYPVSWARRVRPRCLPQRQYRAKSA
jgi:hypothetical protein